MPLETEQRGERDSKFGKAHKPKNARNRKSHIE